MTITVTDQTPRQDGKIAFVSFKIPAPFAEGHTCDAEEAMALNDAYARRVANLASPFVRDRQASEIKKSDEDKTVEWVADWTYERVQTEIVDAYANGDFSWTTDRRADPLDVEMRRLARLAVDKAIQTSGMELSADQFKAKVKEVLAANDEKFRKVAQRNLESILEISL